jgi:hypothetical protein
MPVARLDRVSHAIARRKRSSASWLQRKTPGDTAPSLHLTVPRKCDQQSSAFQTRVATKQTSFMGIRVDVSFCLR